jgi:hypothetical protein
MGWSDSLFESSPQALVGLFARSTRKSSADSDVLKRGEEEFGTGRHLLSFAFPARKSKKGDNHERDRRNPPS